MNQNEYIAILRYSLGKIPEDVKNEIIYDFSEHFEVGLEQGKTEEEIAEALGDPKFNAKQYRAEYIVQKAHTKSSGINVFRAIFAAISLGFFNLIFMLPIFAVVFSIIVSLFAVSFSLTLSGICVLLATLLKPLLPAWISLSNINPWILISGSICMTSLGLLFGLGTVQFTRWCLKITAGYIKANINIIGINKEESIL
jgi:uncharacterized membrane protein